MADDDAASLATASTYWRDAAVLAETFSRRRAPPPKPPAPDLSTMPPMRDHVDAWLARLKALESRWTCPPDAQFRLEVLGAKTRAEEKKWRAKEILRRTPAQEKVVHVEEVERDYAVPQYGPYDVLAYHSGSKGRREFFRIQQAAHARPSLAEETALKMADDADQYEGACFRNFVQYANAKGLLPSPFLSRVDAEERSLDLNGMALGDALGGGPAVTVARPDGSTFRVKLAQKGAVLKHGALRCVEGEGMPVRGTDRRGRLFLRVKVAFPEELDLDDDRRRELERVLGLPPARGGGGSDRVARQAENGEWSPKRRRPAAPGSGFAFR